MNLQVLTILVIYHFQLFHIQMYLDLIIFQFSCIHLVIFQGIRQQELNILEHIQDHPFLNKSMLDHYKVQQIKQSNKRILKIIHLLKNNRAIKINFKYLIIRDLKKMIFWNCQLNLKPIFNSQVRLSCKLWLLQN